ncbi:ABC-type multidrug transport system [Commensalibacter communis]|uniref:ATPase and permease component (MdlB) n=1 Tax=Commensalibacter communis TaxID=2972786 RepID=A0A9W4XC71_9PROT|nr:ABC transporter ATP-binding protein [Commensalibacter communis]CAI3923817.1 ABC-type multidrug transport system [Commensalibacter communis]CAI3925308.1 ABC-type multidrug transport system [Commensalibacter communis]CAI3937139.1 ABC-type multidrug transport system [Commensalibacter communis]CAI3937698.1 ABC-type multidrug transport system [Commensalibacter communis]
MQRLWKEEIRLHPKRILIIVVLTMIMAGLTALYPLVIKRALDMFKDNDPRILYQVPLLVIMVTAAKAASQYGQTLAIQGLVLVVIRGLQKKMFLHLVYSDVAKVEKEAPAQLASRFTTDALSIREAMIRVVNAFGDSITVVGLIASMFYMDWELSLIAALLYPIAAVPIQKLGKKVRRASGNMQEQIGKTAALLNETFAQSRTVRVYGMEQREIERTGQSFDQLYDATLKIISGRARVDPIMEVLGGTAVAAVLGFAGWRAAMGGATLGDFSGFVAALLLAARPLRALGSLNAAMQEGISGLDRIFNMIDDPIEIKNKQNTVALPEGQGQIKFEDVHFIHPGRQLGLQGLDFNVASGLTVALVGPSGAGKSTALTLIPRLHDVQKGRILFDGVDLRDLKMDELRAAIAYVPQDPLLFDMSIVDNILIGKSDATKAELDEVLEGAAINQFVHNLPQGLNTRVGYGGQLLSGGQRQRVALARALLRNPRLLLLDEATSALDTESEYMVQQALAKLRKGRTTLIVAHRLSTVRSADLIVVMCDGLVAEYGNHETLMDYNGLYARLVQTQDLNR